MQVFVEKYVNEYPLECFLKVNHTSFEQCHKTISSGHLLTIKTLIIQPATQMNKVYNNTVKIQYIAVHYFAKSSISRIGHGSKFSIRNKI